MVWSVVQVQYCLISLYVLSSIESRYRSPPIFIALLSLLLDLLHLLNIFKCSTVECVYIYSYYILSVSCGLSWSLQIVLFLLPMLFFHLFWCIAFVLLTFLQWVCYFCIWWNLSKNAVHFFSFVFCLPLTKFLIPEGHILVLHCSYSLFILYSLMV